MRKTITLKVFFTFLLCYGIHEEAFSQAVYDSISGRIRSELLLTGAVSSLDAAVSDYLNTVQADGSWTDIDYQSDARTMWPPNVHLVRLKDMARAYTIPASSHYGSGTLHTAIVNALDFWDITDPQSDNWWYNQISSPQGLGQILLLLRAGSTPVPLALEASLIAQMNRGNPASWTGANKLDIAIHYLYRACLLEDDDIMQVAIDEAFYPIVLTTGEGLQHDNSYMQHGAQLMISSYGSVFLDGEYRIADWVRDTPYALSAQKKQLLSGYYKDTYLRTIRGSYIDFSTEGRGISRPNILRKSGEKGRLERAKKVDPANNATWNAAIARTSGTAAPGYMVAPWHKHFYRGDYTVHQRPGYLFNVRTVSSRTIRTESGNEENLKGVFLPDGATNIQRRGGEYYNIMPVWEWDKIPGTTSAAYTEVPPTATWGEAGSTAFAGGVTDSVYGITAYHLNFKNTTARKAWFFLDDAVVCLGAGINGSGTADITTTINQCWLSGDVLVSGTGGSPGVQTSQTEVSYTDPQWILHDSIGYFIPEGGNVRVSNREQSGSWYGINHSYPDDMVSGDVFKMWVDHGTAPSDATYAYIVVPGVASGADMQSYDLSRIRIVENTPAVQAVKYEDADMMQVVFYQAGTLSDGDVSLTVDRPCTVMLKGLEEEEVKVYIADPAQQQSIVTLFADVPGISGTRQLECPLPAAPHSGATAYVVIDENTPEAGEILTGLPVIQVTASADDGNVPANTIDDNLGTRWSAEGDGQWIRFDLGAVHTITGLGVGWYLGDQRSSSFDVEVSADGTGWTNIYSGTSAGNTTAQENYDLPDTSGRYVRIIGHGNSSNDWNSITEVDVFGYMDMATATYGAVSDAFVRDGSYADTNYGGNTSLILKKDGTGYSREVYLQFDLDSVQLPVSNAVLRLYCSYGNTTAESSQWQLSLVPDNNWTESGITWNNKPAGTTVLDTRPGTATPGYTDWDITTAVNSLSSGGLLSLVLVSTVGGQTTDAGFVSSEALSAAQHPEIICTYESLPETSARVSMLPEVQELQTTEENTVLFPNPLSFGKGTISSDVIIRSVKVYSKDGRLVQQTDRLNTTGYELDLTGFAPGVYFVVISGDTTEVTKKVVKP